MAVLTRPLSASEVQKAKPAEKDYELFDGQGLTLFVRTSGKKIWRFRYKRPGSASRTTINCGAVPASGPFGLSRSGAVTLSIPLPLWPFPFQGIIADVRCSRHAVMLLRQICSRYCVTKILSWEMPEQISTQADMPLHQSMNGQECDHYPERMPEPLRGNSKHTLRQNSVKYASSPDVSGLRQRATLSRLFIAQTLSRLLPAVRTPAPHTVRARRRGPNPSLSSPVLPSR